MYHPTKPVKKSLQSNFAALEFDRFTKQVDCFFITTEHLACFIKNDGNQDNPRIVGVASD
tara:strand:+ start:457 stop:636 length:180 start_codon:yes stop_codon:yes gene_type:complete